MSGDQWESPSSWNQGLIAEHQADSMQLYTGPDTSAQLVALGELQDIADGQQRRRSRHRVPTDRQRSAVEPLNGRPPRTQGMRALGGCTVYGTAFQHLHGCRLSCS